MIPLPVVSGSCFFFRSPSATSIAPFPIAVALPAMGIPVGTLSADDMPTWKSADLQSSPKLTGWTDECIFLSLGATNIQDFWQQTLCLSQELLPFSSLLQTMTAVQAVKWLPSRKVIKLQFITQFYALISNPPSSFRYHRYPKYIAIFQSR